MLLTVWWFQIPNYGNDSDTCVSAECMCSCLIMFYLIKTGNRSQVPHTERFAIFS